MNLPVRFYNAGREMRRRGFSWMDITDHEDFDGWAKNKTKEQLDAFILGINNKPYENIIPFQTGGLFPFGRHENKPMNKVPPQDLHWYMQQPWITKWPTVIAYYRENEKQILQALNDVQAGWDEIRNFINS